MTLRYQTVFRHPSTHLAPPALSQAVAGTASHYHPPRGGVVPQLRLYLHVIDALIQWSPRLKQSRRYPICFLLHDRPDRLASEPESWPSTPPPYPHCFFEKAANLDHQEKRQWTDPEPCPYRLFWPNALYLLLLLGFPRFRPPPSGSFEPWLADWCAPLPRLWDGGFLLIMGKRERERATQALPPSTPRFARFSWYARELAVLVS